MVFGGDQQHLVPVEVFHLDALGADDGVGGERKVQLALPDLLHQIHAVALVDVDGGPRVLVVEFFQDGRDDIAAAEGADPEEHGAADGVLVVPELLLGLLVLF